MISAIKSLFARVFKRAERVKKRKHYRVYAMGGGPGDRIERKTLLKEHGQFKGMKVLGWKSVTPRDGDVLVAFMESGRYAAMVFTNVTHYGDPRDMFHADAICIGYCDELKIDPTPCIEPPTGGVRMLT